MRKCCEHETEDGEEDEGPLCPAPASPAHNEGSDDRAKLQVKSRLRDNIEGQLTRGQGPGMASE